MEPSARELLAQGCSQLSFVVSDQQQLQLMSYLDLMFKWNKVANLTAITNQKDAVIKHLLDSLVASPYLENNNRVIDVGTGAGLPGIPLAIINPEINFTLLDTAQKRTRFVRQAVHELTLTNNVEVVTSRVEAYRSAAFDGVISRAFASLKDMLHSTQHLVGLHGRFFALKGQLDVQECAQLSASFQMSATHELTVPFLEAERHLLIIEKV